MCLLGEMRIYIKAHCGAVHAYVGFIALPKAESLGSNPKSVP